MKKKVSYLFLAMMAVFAVLAGCGSSETSGGEAAEDKKKETLKVVTNAAYAPMEYMDKGEIVGLDADFIKAVAEEAGYEIDLQHIGWDPLFIEVESERADLAVSSITIDDDRKQKYEFSVPYFLSTNKILVKEGSDIQSAEDLKGKTVAVQTGTTGHYAVEKVVGKNSKDIKKFEENTLAIMELVQGGADAVVADNAVIEEYAKNNPNEKLVVVEDEDAFEAEYYGIMFPKGSELKEDFDKAINRLFDNGKYEEIYGKWLSRDANVDKLKEQQ
ncbi:MAG: transporter substrate-binding domain-containing protein [Bacillus sp. (in: firmicutes)]